MLVFVYLSYHITTYRPDSDLHIKGKEKQKKRKKRVRINIVGHQKKYNAMLKLLISIAQHWTASIRNVSASKNLIWVSV